MMACHTQSVMAVWALLVIWTVSVLAMYRRRTGNGTPFLEVLLDLGEAD